LRLTGIEKYFNKYANYFSLRKKTAHLVFTFVVLKACIANKEGNARRIEENNYLNRSILN